MFHHKFKDGERSWDTADKELYAIVYAFDRYRNFLAQPKYPVQVFSDHRNLAKFMFTTDLLNSRDGRLGRWYEQLAAANFTIEYRTGETNVVADFLSRYGYDDTAAINNQVSLPTHRFLQKSLDDFAAWFRTQKEPRLREITIYLIYILFISIQHCTSTLGCPCWSACLDARPQAPSFSSPSLVPPALQLLSTVRHFIRPSRIFLKIT